MRNAAGLSRVMLATAGISAATGCGPVTDSACPQARTLFNGECCVPWSVAQLDRCVLSTWDTPDQGNAIGPAGASDPEVAVDNEGRVVLTWTEAREASATIAIADEQADGTFAVHYPAQALSGLGEAPSLAADATGRALVSWRQQVDGTGAVYYAQRATDGEWEQPPGTQPLSHAPTAYEPRSIYAPSGETMVVYNQWTGENFGVAVASRDAKDRDGPLTAPAPSAGVLSPPVLFSNAPVPAIASNGDAIITWYQAPDNDLMTFVSERFGSDGAFSRPAADAFISPQGAPVANHGESNPAPAIHDRGSAVVAWTQENAQGHTPVFLATRDGWGRWTNPAGLDDAFSVPAGTARCVQTTFGGDGSLYVTWFEENLDAGLRVYASYRAPDGAWVEHGKDAVQLSTEGHDGIHPAVAVGPAGQALIAYAERDGVAGRWSLVVRRRNPGRAVWLPPEILSDNLTDEASEPTVAWRDGVFVVAWVQGPLLGGSLYFARTGAAADEAG